MTDSATTSERSFEMSRTSVRGLQGERTSLGKWRRLQGVVASELIRLVTTRATVMMMLAASFLLTFVGAIAALTASGETNADTAGPPGFTGGDPITTVFAGQNLAVLILAILGVIIGAREYSTHLTSIHR